MLKIKLKPTGKIHQRSFRVVVAPQRSKFDGKIVADIGFYTPQTNTIKIDETALKNWLKNGAQLTPGVDKLLHPDKYPRKKKKTKVTDNAPVTNALREDKPLETKTEAKEETKTEETKAENTDLTAESTQ